jgi:transcriptional regulator with XRE-family HTH domain
LQRDVSKAIGVDTLTVCNRENNLTTPRLYSLPNIYQVLGCNPSQNNATTPGEKIKEHRIQHRLRLRRLAKQLGIEPGTLARWEKGEGEPRSKLQKRINSFLSILAGSIRSRF